MNKLKYLKTFPVVVLCILIAGISFSKTTDNKNSRPLIVIIDPGHGGKDTGAANKNIREKDVVLEIGLKLGKLINDNYSDVKVIFTRSTDVFVPLIERSRIANKNKADLFISLHANSCGTPSTRGTETFALGLHRSDDNLEVAKKENSVILLEDDYKTTYEDFDPNLSESYIMFEMMQDVYMDQSLSFADDIQQQLRTRVESPNRGVKQAGFLVLRQSSMPSVLVEAGFISNKTEANYLNSEDGQQIIAHSILEAFRKFKNKHSGNLITKAPDNNVLQPKPKDTVQKSEVRTEIEKPAEHVAIAKDIEKPEPIKTEIDTTTKPKLGNNVYYTIQIAASITPVEPIAANFKGLKNLKRDKTDKYYRFYFGNESDLDKITTILQQVKLKFPQAFIVSFVDGKRIPLNVGSK